MARAEEQTPRRETVSVNKKARTPSLLRPQDRVIEKMGYQIVSQRTCALMQIGSPVLRYCSALSLHLSLNATNVPIDGKSEGGHAARSYRRKRTANRERSHEQRKRPSPRAARGIAWSWAYDDQSRRTSIGQPDRAVIMLRHARFPTTRHRQLRPIGPREREIARRGRTLRHGHACAAPRRRAP